MFAKLLRFFRQPPARPATDAAETNTSAAAEQASNNAYAAKIQQELTQFKEVTDVHALPPIFSYWADKFLIPMCRECGVTGVEQFYAKYLKAATERTGLPARFVSIGAGNCDTEVRVAKLLLELGLEEFSFECLELNPSMLERGKEDAIKSGLEHHLVFVKGDFNSWAPKGQYTGVMANHSLHHVVNLEGLFDSIKSALHPQGYFVASDMVGRNGHQRWPEALAHVERIWNELPARYHYNALLKRVEPKFVNWDCSSEGFEGIRAQDVLPLLVERFDFPLYIGFANVISPFIDRGFGHNFDVNSESDRALIDSIHALDEEGFRSGELKPTQMLAVMSPNEVETHVYARGISPEQSLRLQT